MDSVNVTPELSGYKDVSPIKFFCRKVLPCVYDDSLSPYELVCKCIKYLNTVIENSEGVQENVQNLYDAFVELQSWVNSNVNEGVFAEFVDRYISENDGVQKAIEGVAKPVVEREVDSYIESVTDFQVANTFYGAPDGYIGKPGFRRIVEADLPSGYPIDDLVTDNPYRPLSARQGKKLNESKAPSGYGLGTSEPTQITDANERLEFGVHSFSSGCLNVPFEYGTILVIPRNGNYTQQMAFDANSNTVCIRFRRDSKWGVWEYLNPPMLLGVEYRTTERFFNKPVYVKAISLGALPNTATKDVSNEIYGVSRMIDWYGELYDLDETQVLMDNPIVEIIVSLDEVRVTTTEDLSLYSAIIVLKYTKTIE